MSSLFSKIGIIYIILGLFASIAFGFNYKNFWMSCGIALSVFLTSLTFFALSTHFENQDNMNALLKQILAKIPKENIELKQALPKKEELPNI